MIYFRHWVSPHDDFETLSYLDSGENIQSAITLFLDIL